MFWKLSLLWLVSLGLRSTHATGTMICYYDASSNSREGPGHISIAELQPAIQFCNLLVYGYAGIDAETYQLQPLNKDLATEGEHYRAIMNLKRGHPQLRILLSVGGDHDIDATDEGAPNKYLTLLENPSHRQTFIRSAVDLIQTFRFDGIDLAWQFPKTHPKEIRSGFGKALSTIKGWFTGPKVVDEHAEEHKEQFTALLRDLIAALRPSQSYLTLTMLPHVDPALFIDIPTVMPFLDFVNLAAFDFQTPLRDPKVADYPASLYPLYERPPEHNIDYQVQYWLNNTTPSFKIIVGVPAYGRTWIMSRDSGITGYPPIPKAQGAAPGGRRTQTQGLLSWPEICAQLNADKDATGPDAPLRKVGDPTKRYGTYAYRAADDNGEHGLWVAYEEPNTAAIKAGYANAKDLGGVALFDLSYDDFRGECAGEKFPILRSIKYKL